MYVPEPLNQGDDIAGYVHEVGFDVYEFKPGDRVAAFHEMMKPYGSYGEFAVAEQHTTFHIPKETSFEGTSGLLGPHPRPCAPRYGKPQSPH